MQRTQGKKMGVTRENGVCKAEKDTKVMLNDAEALTLHSGITKAKTSLSQGVTLLQRTLAW